MKKLLTCIILLYSTQFSFGQKTFSSRTEASTWLKETFSKCFIKTGYTTGQGTRHYYYDYELGDNYLIIKEKYIYQEGTANEIKELKWYSIFYHHSVKLTQTTAMAQYTSFIQVKGDEIHGGDGVYINPFRNEWKAFDFYFPFDLTKEKNVIQSIQSAIDHIKLCDEQSYQRYSDSIDLAKKEKEDAFTLKLCEVYTPDSVKINFHSYVATKRPFKDKPTLLVTFSTEWCNPCMIKIDSILNSDLALKYNIVLVNKDTRPSLSVLNLKIAKRIPDYNKRALLLFDLKSQLEPIDKNGAPFFVILDKELEIKSSFVGYGIGLLQIRKELEKLE